MLHRWSLQPYFRACNIQGTVVGWTDVNTTLRSKFCCSLLLLSLFITHYFNYFSNVAFYEIFTRVKDQKNISKNGTRNLQIISRFKYENYANEEWVSMFNVGWSEDMPSQFWSAPEGMAPPLRYPQRYNLDGNLEDIAPTTDFACTRCH